LRYVLIKKTDRIDVSYAVISLQKRPNLEEIDVQGKQRDRRIHFRVKPRFRLNLRSCKCDLSQNNYIIQQFGRLCVLVEDELDYVEVSAVAGDVKRRPSV
jgi:hypothetical protein